MRVTIERLVIATMICASLVASPAPAVQKIKMSEADRGELTDNQLRCSLTSRRVTAKIRLKLELRFAPSKSSGCR